MSDKKERPWMWTQATFGVRVGLTVLGWIYDWQHRKDVES